MSQQAQRKGNVGDLVISSGNSISGVIDMRNYAGGLVQVPDEWTAADIGFLVSDTQDGTFVKLVDESGSRVKITGITTNESKAYNMPLSIFGVQWVKLESINTSTEAPVNQTPSRVVSVILKS